MVKVKITNIEERRRQKRQCERRRRAKIRNDPEKREEQRIKNHERYEENKEKGIVKLVKDLSRRDKKKQRKVWVQRQKKTSKKSSYPTRYYNPTGF